MIFFTIKIKNEGMEHLPTYNVTERRTIDSIVGFVNEITVDEFEIDIEVTENELCSHDEVANQLIEACNILLNED